MTPFGCFLLELRRTRRLRQKQLANLLKVDASYLSGLESGRKGPPSQALVRRLQVALCLDDEETIKLEQAAAASRRKYEIPIDAQLEEYQLMSLLINQIGQLKPAQINAIIEILKL